MIIIAVGVAILALAYFLQGATAVWKDHEERLLNQEIFRAAAGGLQQQPRLSTHTPWQVDDEEGTPHVVHTLDDILKEGEGKDVGD